MELSQKARCDPPCFQRFHFEGRKAPASLSSRVSEGGSSPDSGPAERFADEPAEHAAGGDEMVAGEGHLAGIAAPVLGIERASGPGVLAPRLHVEEHLLADPARAVRVPLPGQEAADRIAPARREANLRRPVV